MSLYLLNQLFSGQPMKPTLLVSFTLQIWKLRHKQVECIAQVSEIAELRFKPRQCDFGMKFLNINSASFIQTWDICKIQWMEIAPDPEIPPTIYLKVKPATREIYQKLFYNTPKSGNIW